MSVAQTLNTLSDAAARQALEDCCAASEWIERILAARPFLEDKQVFASAAEIWWSLNRDQWLAAFAAHPQIGDLSSLRKKYASTAQWAKGEQSSVAQAGEETLRELARYNQLYVERFGFIFIVCATGRSANDMLALLMARVQNDEATELPIAAAEQLKITLLRLQKLIS